MDDQDLQDAAAELEHVEVQVSDLLDGYTRRIAQMEQAAQMSRARELALLRRVKGLEAELVLAQAEATKPRATKKRT